MSCALNGEHENALSLLQQLEHSLPHNIDVQFLGILCARALGRRVETPVIAARPTVFHRALSSAIAGNHHEALLILDPLYAEHPADLWVCYLRAHCLARDNRVEQARGLANALHAGYGMGPWTRIVSDIDRNRRRRKIKFAAACVVVIYGLYLSALWLTSPGHPKSEPTPRPVARSGAPAAKPESAPAQNPETTGDDDFDRYLQAAEKAVEYVPAAPNAPLNALFNALPGNEAYFYLSERLRVEDVPLIEEWIDKSPNVWVQRDLVRLMGHLRHPACRNKLNNLLITAKSDVVRAESAWAIGQIADQASVQPLERALRKEKSSIVRKNTAAALAKIGGDSAKDTLRAVYEEEKAPEVKVTLQWLLNGAEYMRTVPPVLTPGRVCGASYEGTFYHLYVPASYRPDEPADILVSVHGTDGTSDGYMNMWLEDADRFGVVVIAPYFDYPQYHWFGNLNIDLDAIRADRRLFDIIDQVKQIANVNTRQIMLFGHSQGGQFVTSFTCAHPHRVFRAAACGTRKCISFSAKSEFPAGLKPHPLATDLVADFDPFLQADFAFVIGTSDERIASCQTMYEDIKKYAKTRGVPVNISFLPVPNGKHAGVENRPTASAFLFRDREPIAITRNRSLNEPAK
jgi:pimeloyl-ACP methyl ester carboxylesterase